MVPGFYVSRWQTSNWDVTSRGFGPGLAYTNQAYINQLLVLIDGVTVYTPLFPGVWWALQDLDMAQIDRIEVIRGPGGILWGSNAVHGVVHVITKDARETLGPRISGRASEDERHLAASSGIPLGDDGALRLWIKGARYDALEMPFLDIDDSYGIDSFGGRADWTDSDGHEWTAWARGYDADIYEIGFDLVDFVEYRELTTKRGYLAHVRREDVEDGESIELSYVSDQQRRPTFFDLRIDTVDLQYRRDLYRGEQLEVQGGAQWYHVQSEFVGDDPPYWDFDPQKVSLDTLRAFALGTYTFGDPAWKLVGGGQPGVQRPDLLGGPADAAPVLRAGCEQPGVGGRLPRGPHAQPRGALQRSRRLPGRQPDVRHRGADRVRAGLSRGPERVPQRRRCAVPERVRRPAGGRDQLRGQHRAGQRIGLPTVSTGFAVMGMDESRPLRLRVAEVRLDGLGGRRRVAKRLAGDGPPLIVAVLEIVEDDVGC